MNLTARQLQIVKTLYARNRSLADGTDDQRRQLVMLIAQQIAFEFGLSWGTKRADPGRPLSKDAIAYSVVYSGTGTLLAWDLFNGATRVPFDNPSSIDITGQMFVPVQPVNHLGDVTVPDVPPVVPPTPPPAIDFQSQIDGLVRVVGALAIQVNDLQTRLANPIRTTTDFYHSHYVKI
jgi:hypothetical protein